MKKMLQFLLVFVLGTLSSTVAYAMVIAPSFSDVRNSDWYADAVDIVVLNKWMQGYGNGTFGPNDSVTRGQFAVILDRYDADVSESFKSLRSIVCLNKSNYLNNVSEYVDETKREQYKSAIEHFCNSSHSFRYDGCADMFDPITGEQLGAVCP